MALHGNAWQCTLACMEAVRTDHEITPAAGTVRKLDGTQGSVLIPGDYPLTARCRECGRPVRVEEYMLDHTWRHLDDEVME